MRLSTVLTEARQIIDDHGLGKGHYAMDQDGKHVPLDSPDAASYCALGAFYKARNGHTWDFEDTARGFDILSRSVPFDYLTVPAFNDAESTTKQDILDLYDRAIAKAEEIEKEVKL